MEPILEVASVWWSGKGWRPGEKKQPVTSARHWQPCAVTITGGILAGRVSVRGLKAGAHPFQAGRDLRPLVGCKLFGPCAIWAKVECCRRRGAAAAEAGSEG